MSDMYAIKTSTLTAIGDAVRGKKGYAPFTDHFSFTPDKGGFQHTTPSASSKNRYIIDVVDMIYTPYDAVQICSDIVNTSSSRLLYENIRNVKFPVSFDVDSKQIAVQFSLSNDSADSANDFAEVNVIVIPLDENGNEYKYTPLEMAEEINNLLPAPTTDELTITGNCNHRFFGGGWNWFINKYGDKITTKDITDLTYMFYMCDELTKIPFELNCKAGTSISCSSIFSYDRKLVELPKINTVKPNAMDSMFNNCEKLAEIPENYFDNWDWTAIDNATSAYTGKMSGLFYNCYSLRKFPMTVLTHGNPIGSASYSVYNNTFYCCYVLDEIIDMPNPHYNETYNKSGYNGLINSNFVNSTHRLKNFTFREMNPVNWANQTLDLSYYVGWSISSSRITNYSGIGTDKQVKDDATYQALKDDPDWWTDNVAYSRYNHDSAVRTINSLPSAIEYQTANSQGANIVKFKGTAGSATDGGAINTLTEEEIAVATAKGWTVSLV